MGAILAHHIAQIKLKPFQGKSTTKKTESIGSLLTPIFQYTLGDLSDFISHSTPAYIGEEYLRNAKILKAGWRYIFKKDGTEYTITLPQPAYMELCHYSELLFDPPQHLLTPTAGRQSFSTQPSQTTSPPAQHTPHTRPSTSHPPPPEDMGDFGVEPDPDFTNQSAVNQWLVTNSKKQSTMLQRIWTTLTCGGRDYNERRTPPPERRSPPSARTPSPPPSRQRSPSPTPGTGTQNSPHTVDSQEPTPPATSRPRRSIRSRIRT